MVVDDASVSSHQNISDIITKVVSWCTVHNTPQLTLVSAFLHQFQWHSIFCAYYLFLSWPARWTVQANSRIDNMLKRTKFGKNNASDVRFGSNNGAFVTAWERVCRYWLIGNCFLFVDRSNMWQTIEGFCCTQSRLCGYVTSPSSPSSRFKFQTYLFHNRSNNWSNI